MVWPAERNGTCTGEERIEFERRGKPARDPFVWPKRNRRGDESDLQKSHAVYVAVHAIAEALHQIISCDAGTAILNVSTTYPLPWDAAAFDACRVPVLLFDERS